MRTTERTEAVTEQVFSQDLDIKNCSSSLVEVHIDSAYWLKSIPLIRINSTRGK